MDIPCRLSVLGYYLLMTFAVPPLVAPPHAVDSSDPTDAELDAIVLLSEVRLVLLRHRRAAERRGKHCAHCDAPLDPRTTLVVNRAIGLAYCPECAP